MSVASVVNKTLQLAELIVSNEKYSGATGYVASSSTFSSSVNGTSLTVPEISASGDINCAASSNSGATTFNTPGLTITRNVTNSLNEFDFVAMNETTTDGINFYVGQPNTNPVNSTTLPKLEIGSTGVAVNGILSLKNSNGVATATLECLATDNIISTASPIQTSANLSATALSLNNSNGVATATLECLATDNIISTASPIQTSANLSATALSLNNSNGVSTATLSCGPTLNTILTANPIQTSSTMQCSILYLVSNPSLNSSLYTNADGTILYFNGNQLYP
jgi:hypothetical protein